MLIRLLPALLTLVFVIISTNAFARPSHEDVGVQIAPIVIAQSGISMREAIDRVQRSTGGRVLDAKDSGDHYRIKVLTRDGEVQVIRVDARTGRVK